VTDTVWRASRFNVHVAAEEDVFLLNTLYRSVLRVPKSIASLCQKSSLSQRDVEAKSLHSLIEAGMLIPDYEDEWAVVERWYERISHDYSQIRCTVALTSTCNLACGYCFETGALRAKPCSMTKSTAASLLQWLCALSHHSSPKGFHIVFYGGEPTIVPTRMLQIAEDARCLLRPTGSLTFGMYTNGVTFSPMLKPLFASEDFTWAQIALDGPEKVHDKRRHLHSGQGTFKQIWRNIEFLTLDCNVKVRIVANFDKDNFDFIPILLDKIADSSFRSWIQVAFNPVFNTGLNHEYCGMHSFPEKHSYELWRILHEQAVQRGLDVSFLRMLDKGPCSIHRAANLFISPSGDIYECIGLLGLQTGVTGNVKAPFDPEALKRRDDWRAFVKRFADECKSCSYLPLCLGGCRFKALCETKSLEGPMCHKELIETCELPLVKILAKNG